MSTTAVFIELLIAGVQASIWVAVLIVGIFGYDWIAPLMPVLEKWTTLVTFMVFTFWYTLGIIIDRFASGLVAPIYRSSHYIRLAALYKRLAALFDKDKPRDDKSDEPRLRILLNEKGVSGYLEFTRSRLRIMRDTTLNLILLILSMLIFITLRNELLGNVSKFYLCVIVLGTGAVSVFILIGVAYELKAAYERRLEYADQELSKKAKQE